MEPLKLHIPNFQIFPNAFGNTDLRIRTLKTPGSQSKHPGEYPGHRNDPGSEGKKTQESLNFFW